MANILISQAVLNIEGENYIPALFEGWARVLVREGNNVMHLITNDFVRSPWVDTRLKPDIDIEKVRIKVKEFNPDLIITSNNSIIEDLIISSDCPIITCASDHPKNHFSQHYYKKYSDRYHFFCGHQETLDETKKLYNLTDDKVSLMLPATDVRSEDLKQDKNISFVGSHWDVDDNFQKVIFDIINTDPKNRFVIRDMIKFFILNPSTPSEDIARRFGFQMDTNVMSLNTFFALISRMASGNFRIKVLSEIASIEGFYLYGMQNWIDVLSFSSDIVFSYCPEKIFSISDTQNLYNSSKIGFNTSHLQTKSGFSWRVRDIMATNAVLVTDDRSDFREFFPKIKIPTYTNPFEARKICEDLLVDEARRKDISMQCQEAINSSHRFEHRLKDMEEILGIPLLNKETKNGVYDLLNPEAFYKEGNLINNRKRGILNYPTRLKKSIKKRVSKW